MPAPCTVTSRGRTKLKPRSARLRSVRPSPERMLAVRVKEDLDDAKGRVGVGLDVFDIVDGRRQCPLIGSDDPSNHLIGWQTLVLPGDTNNWDVDARENIDRHAQRGKPAAEENEERHDDERVGSSQRDADNGEHGVPIKREWVLTRGRLWRGRRRLVQKRLRPKLRECPKSAGEADVNADIAARSNMVGHGAGTSASELDESLVHKIIPLLGRHCQLQDTALELQVKCAAIIANARRRPRPRRLHSVPGFQGPRERFREVATMQWFAQHLIHANVGGSAGEPGAAVAAHQDDRNVWPQLPDRLR